MRIQKVERFIHFYGISFEFEASKTISDLFHTFTTMSKTGAKIRYQYFGDKYVSVYGVDNEKGIMKGKLRSIRTDAFPEGINMTTDVVEDLDTAKFDGIVETSHFIIDYRKTETVLALEYNHHGAKVEDFIRYIERVAINYKICKKVGYHFLVRNSLASLKKRLGRVSQMTVKIHKSYIPELENADHELLQAAKASVNQFENKYAILNFNIDYKEFDDTPKIKKTIFGILKYFEDNPNKKHIFNYLKVKAEDEELGNKLQVFDLILDKEQSKIRVEKKPLTRVIVSEDIFPKMQREIDKKNFK
ncbi:hypothetical protein [Flavobacterium chungnamense]|uniref:DUF4868 domain-containing protein n=1 Tax=Flavobacterium chungnamense TaxID=706182 RepID=A0ABP7UZE7_9FLAO